MEFVEEEKRQKEERDLQDFLETIALDDAYFASKDLQSKGRDVHPTAKQRKVVQEEAAKIRFVANAKRRPGLTYDESLDAEEIDLKARPRVFISNGLVNRYEPGMDCPLYYCCTNLDQCFTDNLIRKFNRRHLIIFNDVVLVATKKDSSDVFEVNEVRFIILYACLQPIACSFSMFTHHIVDILGEGSAPEVLFRIQRR